MGQRSEESKDPTVQLKVYRKGGFKKMVTTKELRSSSVSALAPILVVELHF